MPDHRLRIGVLGAGHFGRYHALKVAAAGRAVLAGVHDLDAERAEAVAWEAGGPALGVEALLAASDAVIVAAPAAAHHALGAAALRAGKHVLMEKPIAASLAEADDLAALAAERNLVFQVGHLERFSAAHGALASRMGRPLYIEATRIAPFKQRGTDVSVILDLMIHDLDLILSLVDSPIEQRRRRGGGGRERARGHRQRPRALHQRLCGDRDREPHLVSHRAADAHLLGRRLHGGGLRGAPDDRDRARRGQADPWHR